MKKTIIFCAFALASIAMTSCGNHDHAKQNNSTNSTASGKFECPMKCEPASDKAGKCSKCGMDLVQK